MQPSLIPGGVHLDRRGELKFNNSFKMSQIKRFYTITFKKKLDFRRWQGHKIEQRWFVAICGNFKIQLIFVDNWNKSNTKVEKINFDLSSDALNVLHIPNGYLTSIQASSDNSILLAMSDYNLNEINDEYRFPENHFNK